jgi:hypothetical protein
MEIDSNADFWNEYEKWQTMTAHARTVADVLWQACIDHTSLSCLTQNFSELGYTFPYFLIRSVASS